jgi:flagellar hook-basal body complex protein FliE
MIPALSFLAPLTTQTVGDVSGNAVGMLPSGGTSSPDDFSAVLAQVAGNAMADLKTGEAAAISGVEGKASVQQVVESVSNAQSALQLALAVRDKLVSAYQEVSRMTI